MKKLSTIVKVSRACRPTKCGIIAVKFNVQENRKKDDEMVDVVSSRRGSETRDLVGAVRETVVKIETSL
ncbi:hypothetical protein BJX64DRAFT_106865 [Aspergillus heterothallicus]